MSEDSGAGKGLLRFEKMAGLTVVTEAYSKSPLKLLTPRNSGAASWVYSSNFGGGFVGGDSIDIDVQLLPGAEALLLSQASTKVYRSENLCSQVVTAQIGEEAIFYSLPDPVVCFKGARFHQKQRMYLEKSSSLILSDTLHSGREHSGERWAFESYKSQVEIFRSGKKIFFESLHLDSAQGDLSKRQSRFNAFALLVLIGPAFQEQAEEILTSLKRRPIIPKEDFIISASPLADDGVVIRMASSSTEILAEAMEQSLYFLPQRLGDDPRARKW